MKRQLKPLIWYHVGQRTGGAATKAVIMFSRLHRRKWRLFLACALLGLAVGGPVWYINRPEAPSSSPPTAGDAPCLRADEFGTIATEMAPAIFEGSPVTVHVDGDVTCTAGWAHADVTFGSSAGRTGWVILQYVDGEWRWTVDDYWRQFGEPEELCTRLPDALRAPVGCAEPSASAVARPSCVAPTGGPRTLAEAVAAGWEGVCVPGEFCGIANPIMLSKDGIIAESERWGEAHIDVVGDKDRGDLDGDGTDEVAVELDCTTGSGMAAGRLAGAYVVFAGKPAGLTILGVVTAQKQEADVMPTLFESIQLERGSLTANERWYRPSDATCCPSGTATTIWTLDPTGRLTAGAANVTN